MTRPNAHKAPKPPKPEPDLSRERTHTDELYRGRVTQNVLGVLDGFELLPAGVDPEETDLSTYLQASDPALRGFARRVAAIVDTQQVYFGLQGSGRTVRGNEPFLDELEATVEEVAGNFDDPTLRDRWQRAARAALNLDGLGEI